MNNVSGNSRKYYKANRALKSAMVDMHQTLPRPNRLQPTESVSEMNNRSRALANLLGLTRGGTHE